MTTTIPTKPQPETATHRLVRSPDSEEMTSQLSRQFLDFLTGRKFTDVTLYSQDGARFHVHALVLVPHSPLVRELVTSHLATFSRTEKVTIILAETSKATLAAFVKFLYTGKVKVNSTQEIDAISEVFKTLGIDFPQQLVSAKDNVDAGVNVDDDDVVIIEETKKPERKASTSSSTTTATDDSNASQKSLDNIKEKNFCHVCEKYFKKRAALELHNKRHHIEYTTLFRIANPRTLTSEGTKTLTPPMTEVVNLLLSSDDEAGANDPNLEPPKKRTKLVESPKKLRFAGEVRISGHVFHVRC